MNKYVEVIADGVGFAIGNDGRSAHRRLAGARAGTRHDWQPSRNDAARAGANLARVSSSKWCAGGLSLARIPTSHSADVFILPLPIAPIWRRSSSCSIRDTSLPVRIRTMEFDPLHGDSEFDWIVSDWRPIEGGAKYPFSSNIEVGGRS